MVYISKTNQGRHHMDYTKTRVRNDWRYARELMRLAEDALRRDDVDQLAAIAPDLVAASTTLTAYLDERGVTA